MSGPAEALFEQEYYALLKAALRRGGILISQGMLQLTELSQCTTQVVVYQLYNWYSD